MVHGLFRTSLPSSSMIQVYIHSFSRCPCVYRDIWSYNSCLCKLEQTEQRNNIYDQMDFDYWKICKERWRRRHQDVLSLIPSGPGLKITNTPPIFRYTTPNRYIFPYLLNFYAITSRYSCKILGSDRCIFHCPE